MTNSNVSSHNIIEKGYQTFPAALNDTNNQIEQNADLQEAFNQTQSPDRKDDDSETKIIEVVENNEHQSSSLKPQDTRNRIFS